MNLSTQFSQAFVQVSLATATILLTNNCYQKESLTLQIVAISAIPEIQSEAPQPPPPPRPFGKSHRFFSVGVHKSRFLSQ